MMLEQFKKGGPVPVKEQPPGRPVRAPTHNDFAEDAARAAQRYLDAIAHNEELDRELGEWRNRACLAEAEVDQMKGREKELRAEVDEAKRIVAVIRTHYENASRILLDGFAVIKQSAPDRIDLPALAAALAEPMPPPSMVQKADGE